MNEHQFRELFDIALSHVQKCELSREEQDELCNDMFDSYERSSWKKKSEYHIPQQLAPAMIRVMVFTEELEDIRDGKLKPRYFGDRYI